MIVRIRYSLCNLAATSFLLCGMLTAAHGCKKTEPATAAKPESQAAAKVQTNRKTNARLASITPQEAKKRLDSTEGWIYLDVRTRPEFGDGHAPGAWNIPVLVATDDGQGKVANDDFLTVVEANLDKSALIIVGCRSGGRSARAQKLMLKAGYSTVTNMVGGWLGGADSTGKPVTGWSGLDYPIELGDGGDKSYATLLAQRKAP